MTKNLCVHKRRARARSSRESDISFALRQSLTRTRVIDLFRQLDSDRDAQIGLAEFGKVLKAAGVVAPEDVVERLFAQMDLDGDWCHRSEGIAPRASERGRQ